MTNISTYIDFGLSFGSNIWPFIDWQTTPHVLNQNRMNVYLESLFTQMRRAGQNTLYLAFAQLNHIGAYASGNFSAVANPGNDVIIALLKQLQAANVMITGFPDFLAYLVNRAHASNVQVVLSFGGMVATNADFKILLPGGTYPNQAGVLASVVVKYALDALDFDIENPTAISSNVPDINGNTVYDFFFILHFLLTSNNKTMSLTSMLGLEWRIIFAVFLQNFTTYFDLLNLMAYSDTQYWLDANTPPDLPDQGWTIEGWIDDVGEHNASLIAIGFNDGVPYANSCANGGQVVHPLPTAITATNGFAAGIIYKQLLDLLKSDGYPLTTGQPFFWPAQSVMPHNRSRYAVNNDLSNFVSSAMVDFYNFIKGPGLGNPTFRSGPCS